MPPKDKSYLFRRVGDGELLELPFSFVMRQDVLGYVDLPDGGMARRCVALEIQREQEAPATKTRRLIPEIVSDTLGFGQQHVAEFEADRQTHGFTGVEFIRDLHTPEFFRVKCDSPRTWARYVKHRGLVDKNSRNGGGCAISADMLAAAEARAREV